MTPSSISHAQQARRVGTFVHQTMRDRGMNCMRNELDATLVELTPMQLQQVHASATALAKGADSREDMGLLAALRTASAHATRAALAAAGAIYRADVLLPLVSAPATGPTFTRELARLRRPDLPEPEREQAATQLRAMCGPLDHSDLLRESAAAPQDREQAGMASQRERPLDDAPLDEHEPQRGARSAPAARRLRHQVKIYGKTAALTIEAAPVRTAPDEPATASTVMIEGASASARGDGTFDWSDKIVFACALRELPQLLAVLLGWHDRAEFRFHGGKAGKDLSVEHQDHGVFVRLREGKDKGTVAVPVTDADRYAWAMLVLGVMAANEPSASPQAVLAVCRDVMGPPAFLAAR